MSVAITSRLTPEEIETLQELIVKRGIIVSLVPVLPLPVAPLPAAPKTDDSGPSCYNCGTIMTRSGTCHRCPNCGENDGCS